MKTMELNGNEDFSNDLYVEQSLPSGEHMEFDIFGEQQIFPRIGQDYQVEIPDLLKTSDYLSNFKSASFDIRHSEFNGVASEKSTELDSERHSWSDAEKKSFVLGLYIFSRNFVQIKRFLEGIKMEDILSYYYGSFYKSHEYCQWSECRKIKKKGVVGQKIFTGLRQKEFISRILSSVSEEDKNAVMKVCKMFEDEKITFEEYIFSMKNLVGINALVEGVGIGKGKQDLTTMALEPSSRSNQIMPPIPSGKKCASLTFNEIVKYLTGNYRLSKARSNDLFWEAVWPRLLAKGWHSEEPKDQLYVVSVRKNDLVFLVPGIAQFSRRNLTNGKHYFDSVTDVLKKVAADPSLIELENEDDDDTSKIKPEEENVKRHCYLQPRGSVCAAADVMKFTIIDTGLDDGKKNSRVRELRSLSFELSYKIDSIDCLEITDDNMSEGSVILSNREVLSERKNLDKNGAMQVPCPRPDSDKNIRSCEDENRYVKEDDTEYIVPVAKKRRKLTAFDHHAQTDNVVMMNNISEAPEDMKQKIQPLGLAVHRDVVENDTQIQNKDTIDLNLPADRENAEFNGDHDETNKDTSFSEQQLNVNTQRRGTRNRPPTTRVLEAVAFGLLSVNTPRRKGKTSKYKKEKPGSRHLQCARAETDLSHVQSDHLAPGIQENQNGASSDSNRSELGEFQALHEENGPRFSGL